MKFEFVYLIIYRYELSRSRIGLPGATKACEAYLQVTTAKLAALFVQRSLRSLAVETG